VNGPRGSEPRRSAPKLTLILLAAPISQVRERDGDDSQWIEFANCSWGCGREQARVAGLLVAARGFRCFSGHDLDQLALAAEGLDHGGQTALF